MEKIKNITVPTSPSFYAAVRLAAAKQNCTIAAFTRSLLEKAIKEQDKQERHEKQAA